MPISLDIQTGVQTAIVIASLFALVSLISGVRALFQGRKLLYFRMRRDRIVQGWRSIFFAILMAALALLLNAYAKPVAYSFYPPSATPTITPSITTTPTITLTPTISLTPTITETPLVSNTPTITPTPHIPLAIEAQFEGNLTPPVDAAFSKLEFTSQGLDALRRPLDVSTVFTNPISTMYAVFTYDGMLDGVQWTALWYRNGELVNFETLVWEGGTGGSGYSDWSPKAEEWQPGEYQVQIFVGYAWKRVGFFTLTGDPATPTSTATNTHTPTPTITVTPSPTLLPTATITPSRTPWPTATVTPSRTPWPTLTRTPTLPPGTTAPALTPTPSVTKSPTVTPITPTPTITRRPLATPITPAPTITRWPSATPLTPAPTLTRWPTLTSTEE